MTRAAFLKEVRRQFEAMSAEAQAVASQRALGRAVFWWDGLTVAQLQRLLGAVVSARLTHDEVPSRQQSNHHGDAAVPRAFQLAPSERAASAAVDLLAVLRPGQACGSQFSSH